MTTLADPLPPSASFRMRCTGMNCSVTDTSTDSDGTLVSWNWSFGDGATAVKPTWYHIYSRPGTYTVTLLVTDSQGLTDTASFTVTVTAMAIPLKATPVKIQGKQYVDLAWSDASGDTVELFRDGVSLGPTPNDGAHRDLVPRGALSASYTLCEYGTARCSYLAVAYFF